MENTQKINTNSFYKGMNKDSDPKFLSDGEYINAINSTNNSDKGDLFNIGNEPATLKTGIIPYSFIGAIPLINQRYLIFSTDDTNSEIGIYDDRKESYSRLINDSSNPCKLGFNRKNLIKGVSKENADCTESAYWNDGINPARFLNLTNLPYLITFKPDPSGGCDIETVTSNIDCEKLRLSPLLDIPSLTLEKSSISGALSNGSYRIALAYSSPTFRIPVL